MIDLLFEIGKFKDTITVLSPFVALFGALAAAYFIDLGHDRRQRIQLTNERQEKELERKITRRREVYTDAMAQMSTFPAAILLACAPGADRTAPRVIIEKAIETNRGLAKVIVVAESTTAFLVRTLMSEITRVAVTVGAAFGPLLMKDFEIQQQWDTGKMASAEVKKRIDRMGEEIEQGSMTEESRARLQEGIDYWQAIQAAAWKEGQRLQQIERVLPQEQFSAAFRGAVESMSDLAKEVRKAMRTDLGFAYDPKADEEGEKIWRDIRAALLAKGSGAPGTVEGGSSGPATVATRAEGSVTVAAEEESTGPLTESATAPHDFASARTVNSRPAVEQKR